VHGTVGVVPAHPGPADAGELPVSRRGLRELAPLRAALERLEVALVDRARLDSVSWRAIAGDLGITKQSAHRRHAAHDPLRKRAGGPSGRGEFDYLVDGPTEEDLEVVRRLMREQGLGSPAGSSTRFP
jgi:hypothetical protein